MSSEDKPLEFQSRFLLTAIQEASAVIRAIDTKVASLFVVLFLPIAKVPQIADVCRELVAHLSEPLTSLAALLVGLFATCWAVSFFCALRTLLVVDNPAEYIGGARPTGVYYSAALFKIPAWDAFLTRRARAQVDFDTFFESLPKDDLSARRELGFEMMKLALIRTIKMRRAWMTYILVFAWISLGGVVWLWHAFLVPAGAAGPLN